MLHKYVVIFVPLLLLQINVLANPQITNLPGRNTTCLNGCWHVIVDPYENGYYNYRYEPSQNGYFKDEKAKDKSDLVEYDFDRSGTLQVPGDWNSQRENLLYYEGTIWYKKSFDYLTLGKNRLFIHFGAANYHAIVYLNGTKIGEHIGGFTPFNFEITSFVREKNNDIIVKVDNKRYREAVPTVNTDWWNYGGITRDVFLVETRPTFIRDYCLQLKKGTSDEFEGWVQLDGEQLQQTVTIDIHALKDQLELFTNENGYAKIAFKADLELWEPENPKLHEVTFSCLTDHVSESMGFRSVETHNQDIIVNGKPIFLRGICIHEEAPYRGGRAYSRDDAIQLLSWARELGCNFVRLAHYPHNEYMTRLADEWGIMVWSEIPVYWTILWENSDTYHNAETQLVENITRDKNRASVIIWSVANETPILESRTKFLKNLITKTRSMDSTRLVSAALERHYVDEYTQMIDDPLGKYLDVIGCNEYIGWYDNLPAKIDHIKWKTVYNKPLIISEFGAGALYGFHGDNLTRWSEEYQEYLYERQVKMLKKIDFLRGVTPWILMDFRSPRRPLPNIQDGWNRKGLISNKGEKKKAFFVLQKYYGDIMEK
ncbi:beta-glucuronidase [candidate division KSB1 bacterium]|nr:beta-glucuronidase [candidate division KSB1 bacterium]